MEIDLQNPAVFKHLQDQIADIVRFDAIKEANELFVNLDASLHEGKINLKAKNPRLYQNYQSLIVQLKFVLFSGLSDKQCLELIESSLLEALKIENYDFIEKMGMKLTFIEREEDQVAFMRALEKAIEKNAGMLGKDDLLIEGQNLKPTISNWIKDYLSFPAQTGLRTNFEEIEYINKSKNANKLAEADRSKLLEVIKLFDSLKARIYDYDSAPAITDEKEAFKDFDLYNLLPGLEYSNEDYSVSKTGYPYVASQKFELPREVLGAGEKLVESEKLQVKSGEQIVNQSITSPGPSLERRGMGITINEKTASGEAIDSLTLGNKTGAGGSLAGAKPRTSTTLQEKLYQGNISGASGNNPDTTADKSAGYGASKTAQLRAVSGLNPVLDSESSTDKISIANSQNLSNDAFSGGPDGNRTRETSLSRTHSAPAQAHSNELYHTSAQNIQNRVNIQDILNNRQEGTGNRQQDAGLKMGDGVSEVGGRRSDRPENPAVKTLAPSFAEASVGKPALSHPPTPEAMADKGRERGQNTGNNPSSFILNPLLQKKPVVPQNGRSKQAEIDKKLEELQKRIKS